jgi:polyketide synthase 7
MLCALVSELAGAVLGRDEDDPIQAEEDFRDLGFDSLTALELRNKVNSAVGVRLAPSSVFEFRSPAALATRLRRELEAADQAPAAAAHPGSAHGDLPADGLAALYLRACERGQTDLGHDLLLAASRLRDTFDSVPTADDLRDRFAPVPLATGADDPILICCPGFTVVSGPESYAALAGEFDAERRVTALVNPGFRGGEPLPESVEVFIQSQAAAVEAYAGGRPIALVGHSSGGWSAFAVAAALERIGAGPVGVALIDVFPYRVAQSVSTTVAERILATDGVSGQLDGERLTAFAGYIRLFQDWTPEPIAAPTILLRADQPITDDRAHWEFPHSAVDVPGDHFSVLDRHVTSTAAALRDWLDRI